MQQEALRKDIASDFSDAGSMSFFARRVFIYQNKSITPAKLVPIHKSSDVVLYKICFRKSENIECCGNFVSMSSAS